MTGKKERFDRGLLHSIGVGKRVLAIGCYRSRGEIDLCREHLEELASLAHTCGLDVVVRVLSPLRRIEPGTYLGKGKLEELAEKGGVYGADAILFDEEIDPNQQRNLERFFQKSVIDRTELILEIFSQRAQTREARLQVELAQNEYYLPRLKRLWTHFSRQAGGRHLKGEGERQIEIDRRLIRKRIVRLKEEIEEVRHHRETQRIARERSSIPTFGIVGYTNAGKSTLLRALTGADVVVEDKLFATLDTKTCKWTLPNRQRVLLVDTVGFIRKIPHALVAAFKSTLEEAFHTDILLHIVDASHPLAEEQTESTYRVLEELQIGEKPIITVLNKVDLLDDVPSTIARFRRNYPRVLPVSAKRGVGFEELAREMMDLLKAQRAIVKVRIPQGEYAIVSEIMHEGRLIEREYEGNDLLIEAEIPLNLKDKVRRFAVR